MKKCPYCAEEIQDEAVKCRHCGEFLQGMQKEPQMKWYFKTHSIIVAFLCVGPFALPLVWRNPRFSQNAKWIITGFALLFTYLISVMFANAIKTVSQYYQMLSGQF